ncbi:oxidoreductase [Streptomyces malaysiensis]|uniref:oxidoreductase n=1 Tax=Streptomyces malaysiensis TaxID=92644 RepID=UPI0036C651C2
MTEVVNLVYLTTSVEVVGLSSWTLHDVPDQRGRSVIITGGNTGLGFQTASMFADKGADVLIACRDAARAAAAVDRIRARGPRGTVRAGSLDLADLDSVRAFAHEVLAGQERLDALVNNAAVMWTPLARTKQGFESQFGTNHLGHFALTGHLLPLLLRTPGARVTTVTSLAQTQGRIDFEDLNWRTRPYSTGAAYGQSKLANMLFVLELDRRLRAAALDLTVTASHPGWTSTELTRHSPAFLQRVSRWIGMRPDKGALTTMRAATDPGAPGGSYWGPRRLFGTKGHPGPARIIRRAQDTAVAARLWAESTRLTGVGFPLAARTGQTG